jgi:hypothetical protein
LIALIIFSNRLGVNLFGCVVGYSIRWREVLIVRKPLAEFAAEQNFLGRYHDTFALAVDWRTLLRKNISSFRCRRACADDSCRSRESMVVSFLS